MNTKHAAIYCRVSTDTQTTDGQQTELTNYVSRRGWTFDTYIDVMSGTRDSRPSLDRMVREARSGKFHAVVCVKLDRLGRSLIHLATLISEFDRLGVALVCTTQGIDTGNDNPAARFQVQVLAAVAEFERCLIVERVRAGLQIARLRGVRLGRVPIDAGKLRPQVLELKKRGQTVRQIASTLKISLGSVVKLTKP